MLYAQQVHFMHIWYMYKVYQIGHVFFFIKRCLICLQERNVSVEGYRVCLLCRLFSLMYRTSK